MSERDGSVLQSRGIAEESCQASPARLQQGAKGSLLAHAGMPSWLAPWAAACPERRSCPGSDSILCASRPRSAPPTAPGSCSPACSARHHSSLGLAQIGTFDRTRWHTMRLSCIGMLCHARPCSPSDFLAGPAAPVVQQKNGSLLSERVSYIVVCV